MPVATLAECIIDLKALIAALDAQFQKHSIAKSVLSLMLRTDALYINKHELHSLIACLDEQIICASKLGENALDLAIMARLQLSSIEADGGSELTKH